MDTPPVSDADIIYGLFLAPDGNPSRWTIDSKNMEEDVESTPTDEPPRNCPEEGVLELEQPQEERSGLRGIYDSVNGGLRGCYDRVKKKLTSGCSKVTVRVIKLCISLWQIGDMISDGFATNKYLDLARVSRVYTVD